jgi:hypothetical protein
METPEGFWSRVKRKLEPEFESWLVETVPFIKLFASLALSYAGFGILRLIRFPAWLLDILEPLDELAIGIVFVGFLVDVVRSALVRVLGRF